MMDEEEEEEESISDDEVESDDCDYEDYKEDEDAWCYNPPLLLTNIRGPSSTTFNPVGDIDYNVHLEEEQRRHTDALPHSSSAGVYAGHEMSEDAFLEITSKRANSKVIETKEEKERRLRIVQRSKEQRAKLSKSQPHEILAGAVAELVRFLMNITESKYVTSENPESIVRTRDPRGCICSSTLPYTLDSNYVLYNYVTTQGLCILGQTSGLSQVSSFDFKSWSERHHRPLDRATVAAEAFSLYQPRGEQSGPMHVNEEDPTSSIRAFDGRRQTQSGAKDKYGQISSSLLMYYYMARNCGIVCFPFGSNCTNKQMVVNLGFTVNLYRLAEIYGSCAFVPEKIVNVRLRIPGLEKCLLVVWGTGKCVGVGIVEREELEASLRFFYPYLRQCLMQRTDPDSGIEIAEENGMAVGKVDLTKRRTRDGGGAKKRKKRNIYNRKKEKKGVVG